MKSFSTFARSLCFVAALASSSLSVFASGGTGGGGTGGGGGGGGGTVTPPPVVGPAFSSFKSTGGYRPGGGNIGAVWTSYSVNSVGVASGCRVQLTITDQTGQVIWNYLYYPFSITIDDDYVALESVYLVEADLLDASGNVVDSRSTLVTTPKSKAGVL